jgi:hypothetical protein
MQNVQMITEIVEDRKNEENVQVKSTVTLKSVIPKKFRQIARLSRKKKIGS